MNISIGFFVNACMKYLTGVNKPHDTNNTVPGSSKTSQRHHKLTEM